MATTIFTASMTLIESRAFIIIMQMNFRISSPGSVGSSSCGAAPLSSAHPPSKHLHSSTRLYL